MECNIVLNMWRENQLIP